MEGARGRGQQRGRCQAEEARTAGGGNQAQDVSLLLPERGIHGLDGSDECAAVVALGSLAGLAKHDARMGRSTVLAVGPR